MWCNARPIYYGGYSLSPISVKPESSPEQGQDPPTNLKLSHILILSRNPKSNIREFPCRTNGNIAFRNAVGKAKPKERRGCISLLFSPRGASVFTSECADCVLGVCVWRKPGLRGDPTFLQRRIWMIFECDLHWLAATDAAAEY